MAKILLEMKQITKTFPGVKALDNVNLKVEKGEIHALVGENGAGKSTLMNVLSGIYPYGTYEGDIIYDGEVCKFSKIKDSEEKGIVIIHQELALVPEMTIGENMYLGNERGSKYAIDWDKTYGEAEKYLKQVGLKESSHVLIKDIGVGKQQLVEIAKALAKKAKLLILDEPTASLNEEDSKALLDLMLAFKKQGMTMIIITHKLNEVSYVADKITIIRDGSTIETLDKKTDNITEERIIKGMVGRELTSRFPKREPHIGDVELEVKDWTVYHNVYAERKVVDNVSIHVCKGEVLGISTDYDEAIYKAFIGSGINLPKKKNIICTIKDSAKDEFLPIAKQYYMFGYDLYATEGTYNFLKENDVPVSLVNRISAKSNTLFDLMLTDTVDLIIDIPTRNDNLKDGFLIRRFAVEAGIPIFTSLDTAQALITSLEKRHKGDTSLVDITKLK